MSLRATLERLKAERPTLFRGRGAIPPQVVEEILTIAYQSGIEDGMLHVATCQNKEPYSVVYPPHKPGRD